MRGIHLKLISTLVVAGVVPLLLGLVSLHLFGKRSHLQQQGTLFQHTALHTAESLQKGLTTEIRELRQWLALSSLAGQLAEANRSKREVPGPDEIAVLEEQWAMSAPEEPLIRKVLSNPMSSVLKTFQKLDPLLVEILVTDKAGRIIAATNKSSDFWQADETWWQNAASPEQLSCWVEGIEYDRSAGVYAVSISLPIRRSNGSFEGVLKAVVNASPLMASAAPRQDPAGRVQEVVVEDGKILTRLTGKPVPPLAERFGILPPGPSGAEEWTHASGESILLGYAQVLHGSEWRMNQAQPALRPMTVVVYCPLEEVMAPLYQQLRWISLGGFSVVALFGLAGYQIASRKLVRPIGTLRQAAQDIAATAKLHGEEETTDHDTRNRVEEHLKEIDEINTGDELQVLAQDFGLMSRRVLNYHEQMEREISTKTEEIQQDLVIARQFQEALLPHSIPEVPAITGTEAFRLQFSHFYKPALSVGGDFFDVHALGESSAGIFIADVMGHGARSALVTAILRTMLQQTEQQVHDPGALLEILNHRFNELTERTEDLLFVTAVYIVINTEDGTMLSAGAGHPSPLIMSRSHQSVTPLLNDGEFGIALGLEADSTYESHLRNLEDGETLVLYTDGVTEALNPRNEEFGAHRLNRLLVDGLQQRKFDVPMEIMAALHRFMDTEPTPDDICIVSTEIRATAG